jgi:hypothetical protein
MVVEKRFTRFTGFTGFSAGFGVQGSGFGGSGFRALGSEFHVHGEHRTQPREP